MEIKFKKEKGEDEVLYQLRICEMKDAEGMTWEEIKEIINQELGLDYTSSAYRKRYQYYNACNERFGRDIASKKEYGQEIEDKIEELKRERFKLNDVRAAYNKDLREEARKQTLEEIVKDCANRLPKLEYRKSKGLEDSETDMIINLCDIHYGLIIDNFWNKYSPEIAKRRIDKYLDNILKNQSIFKSKNAYVVLGGDLISGNIHKSIQLRNRENIIQQIMGVSELVSNFVKEICNNFESVTLVGVAGNHSRLDRKEDSPIDERLDDLIPWYLKARLEGFENLVFIDNVIDNTFSIFQVKNKRFCLVHGDYDRADTVQKLLSMLPYDVYACIFGHKHHNYFERVQNKPMIMSGSLCGMDDFCVGLRVAGRAEELLVIVDEKGICNYCDIDLNV